MPPAKHTRLVTVDEILARSSPWRDCELWDGIPMVREPSGGSAETIGGRVIMALGRVPGITELGWVTMSEQGFLLGRNPDRMLACDGAFTSRERLPRIPARGFWPCAPDFCIEVKSPDETWSATLMKCGVWLSHGVRVVWAIHPEAREVVVRRPAETEILAHPGDTIDAAPALPAFTLPVASLFAGL